MQKWLIGIDEAGRGPLAGPVAVGVVKVEKEFNWQLVPGVGDSKQISEPNREAIWLQVRALKKAGKLDFAVAMVSAPVIDKVGITEAIRLAMNRALTRLDAYHSVNRTIVKLDGSLQAPREFTDQETIIKGDQKELVIGLASIMAKVTRDRYMRRVATRPAFAAYNFHTHKGYGTKAHQAAIARYGFSQLHRHSYCKNIKVL